MISVKQMMLAHDIDPITDACRRCGASYVQIIDLNVVVCEPLYDLGLNQAEALELWRLLSRGGNAGPRSTPGVTVSPPYQIASHRAVLQK